MIEQRDYADGTYLTVRYPWGLFVGGRAVCTDGTVRNLKRISTTADTFFSVPASVVVDGRTVSGFITTDRYGSDGRNVVAFTAYSYGKNGHLLPGIHHDS